SISDRKLQGPGPGDVRAPSDCDVARSRAVVRLVRPASGLRSARATYGLSLRPLLGRHFHWQRREGVLELWVSAAVHSKNLLVIPTLLTKRRQGRALG